VASIAVFAASSCGGGGSSGPPANLSVSGLKIPASQVVSAVQSMCALAKQAHTDAAGTNIPFYQGPHLAMHQLAAVLKPSHKIESDNLLNAMLAYETDLTKTPPPVTTGNDADGLVLAASNGLRVLKVVPPTCP
jgi:hypothetical protein